MINPIKLINQRAEEFCAVMGIGKFAFFVILSTIWGWGLGFYVIFFSRYIYYDFIPAIWFGLFIGVIYSYFILYKHMYQLFGIKGKFRRLKK